MAEIINYDGAVKTIKLAILQSQYEAAKAVNEKQLQLYYGIGKYISMNSRNGFWGTGAIDAISERLQKELPGLRGFSSRNLRNMRLFYEEWSPYDGTEGNLAVITAKIVKDEIWNLQLPKCSNLTIEQFCSIGFTQHVLIIGKIKDCNE